MAQRRTHVPKFGNFESENDFPYTACFEKARQDKSTGMRMNPNDPEENPDAFKFAKKGNGSRNDSFSPLSINESPNKFAPVEMEQKNHWRTNSRGVASESGSDKSNPDNFASRDRGKNIRKKSTVESDYYVPPSPGPNRHRSTSNDWDMSYGSASVPKFGAWDEKDPTSGEGFTVIFNKVKEEKQIAASRFPAVPPQVTFTNAQKENKQSKLKSKVFTKKWCCLFPSEKDH